MATNNQINNFPKGGAIQVVYVTGAGSATTNTIATDITGSSVVITPTSANNLILILASFAIQGVQASGGPPQFLSKIQCVRDVTVINGTPYAIVMASLNPASGNMYTAVSFLFVDNPATVAATTYKFQQYTDNGAETVTTSNGTVVLMEIPG